MLSSRPHSHLERFEAQPLAHFNSADDRSVCRSPNPACIPQPETLDLNRTGIALGRTGWLQRRRRLRYSLDVGRTGAFLAAEATNAMRSFVFSSRDLPGGLDDLARLSAWRDFLSESYGRHEVSALPGRPFSQRLEGTRFNDSSTPVDVLRFCGTMDRMSWTSRGQAELRSPHFVLCFNRRATPLSFAQRGREILLDSEALTLVSCTESGNIRALNPHDFSAIAIEQVRLRELVGGVEDFLARPLPRGNPTLRHLRRYLDILPNSEDTENDPNLLAHVGTALTDLVALALGAQRDAAELARMRGLRAARLHEIVMAIRKHFADPAFSPRHLARSMGVTDRYIQELLHDAGSSFTQRVLELRLQRARAMLSDGRYDCLKIGEIASASGFNEIPYFNRCFRRRFGTTPTQLRGAKAPSNI